MPRTAAGKTAPPTPTSAGAAVATQSSSAYGSLAMAMIGTAGPCERLTVTADNHLDQLQIRLEHGARGWESEARAQGEFFRED